MAFIEIQYVYGTTTPIPYLAGELNQVQFVQSGNLLYLTHPNHKPAKITRVAANDWRYEYLDIKNGPYIDPVEGDELTTLTLSLIQDRVRLKTQRAANFSGLAIGSYIEYPLENRWVLGQVAEVHSATEISVTCLEERCFVPSTEVFCRGRNTNPLTSFTAVAPASLTSTTSPVFTNSFVVTREVVGNFLRFSTLNGTVFWANVTASKAPQVSPSSFGASLDGNLLLYRAPTSPVTRVKRTITGWLTASQAGFFNLARDVGRWFRLRVDGKIIHVRPVANMGNTTTMVFVEISDPVPVSKDNPERVAIRYSTSKWQRGSFYPGNYPATISLHEQRLVFGGTYLEPNTIWMSHSGDFTNFATNEYDGLVLDSSAINLTFASSTLNEIFWMTSRGVLLVGTAGAEWSVTSSSTREAITPTNVKAEQQSSFGSIYSQAAVAARSTIFLQGGGKKVREVMFDSSADAHVAADATIFAEHILRDHGNGILVAYQQLPDSRIYVVCGDGQVAVMTYEPDQKVYAWSRYLLGGQNAVVNSIAVDQSGAENIVYLNVTRTVNGASFTTIETLRVEYRPTSPTDKTDMVFLDCHVSVPLIELTGGNTILSANPALLPFKGQTISALIDNQPYDGIAVPASGNVVLPATPATRLVLGYSYTSRLVTLPMDLPSERGTSQGKTSRVAQMCFRLLDSLYLEHGPNNRPLLPGNSETANLQSGDFRVSYDQTHDRRPRVEVRTAKALPLTILAVYPEVTQTQ